MITIHSIEAGLVVDVSILEIMAVWADLWICTS